jgi:probable addiction module antidote protein
MQKNTGKIGSNGTYPPSQSFEPIMLQGLETTEGAREEINFVLRNGEPGDLFLLLQDIAKAQGGFSKLARETGLSRVNLYSALSETGNPRFDSISKVLNALGMQVTVEPLQKRKAPRLASTAKIVKAPRALSKLRSRTKTNG